MNHGPQPLLCLDGAAVLRVADRGRLIAALAEGFKALSRGEVQAPPRPKIDVPGLGLTLAMLAWAPGQLITQKTVSVFHGNHARGVASHQALISLSDFETGVPVAIMDGSSVTALRTTGAAMLSVRELARSDARIATVIGAGVQGTEHLRQLGLVGAFSEIRVWSRNAAAARAAAAASPVARAVDDLAHAVATSDVVCLTTAADTAVIDAGWVRPGTHVTSVGYAPPGSELPLALVDRASVFVEARSAYQQAPVGCAELAGRDASRGTELGEVLLGTKPGRRDAGEITLYKSMGNGMEDLVAANLIYAEARRLGLGQTIRI